MPSAEGFWQADEFEARVKEWVVIFKHLHPRMPDPIIEEKATLQTVCEMVDEINKKAGKPLS
jgi:hypothetical protein